MTPLTKILRTFLVVTTVSPASVEPTETPLGEGEDVPASPALLALHGDAR